MAGDSRRVIIRRWMDVLRKGRASASHHDGAEPRTHLSLHCSSSIHRRVFPPPQPSNYKSAIHKQLKSTATPPSTSTHRHETQPSKERRKKRGKKYYVMAPHYRPPIVEKTKKADNKIPTRLYMTPRNSNINPYLPVSPPCRLGPKKKEKINAPIPRPSRTTKESNYTYRTLQSRSGTGDKRKITPFQTEARNRSYLPHPYPPPQGIFVDFSGAAASYRRT